jgi:MFS family permease
MEDMHIAPVEPRALARNRDFLLFVGARVTNIFGIQTLEVAVGWHLYQMTSNPLDLGLLGLSLFAPVLLLFLVAGLAADQFDRRAIIVVCNLVHAAAAIMLLFIAFSGQRQTWPIFAVMFVNGAARAFFHPASQAILPNIVSKEQFPSALAYATSVHRIGQLAGPAAGGILIAVVGNWVYVSAGLMFGGAAIAAALIAMPLVIRQAAGLSSVLDGLRFIWKRKIVLGAMSLDLLAVLFGGIMGIMPVFARDVLHVGPEGFGVMRAMPALGSLAMALVLAQLSAPGHMGRVLFMALTAFGTAIVVFSLSSLLWLSLLALAVYGAADMVSVYVRQTLVQIATPDAMRGRVSAVNSVSITASNELGDFRAGTMAAAIGTVPAVLLGGLVTLGVAAAWSRLFPELRRVDRLDQVR